MTTTELREQLTAERDALDLKARQLQLYVDETEEKYKAARDKWYQVYVRKSDLEKQLVALDALAEQLETKSPGSETGADENTTQRKEP